MPDAPFPAIVDCDALLRESAAFLGKSAKPARALCFRVVASGPPLRSSTRRGSIGGQGS